VINVSSMLAGFLALIRSAYNGAKHFLNAITANFGKKSRNHPGSRYPRLTGSREDEFGLHALHAAPIPASSRLTVAEDVAAVIAGSSIHESRTFNPAGARSVLRALCVVGTDPSTWRRSLAPSC